MRRNHPTEARACDELRLRWLGWLGPNRSPVEAMRAIGWDRRQQPHWLSSGKIPPEWREKLARQIGTAA